MGCTLDEAFGAVQMSTSALKSPAIFDVKIPQKLKDCTGAGNKKLMVHGHEANWADGQHWAVWQCGKLRC